MKRLVIEYDGMRLFDGEVDEFAWNDNAGGVTVAGKYRKEQSQQGLPAFLEKFAQSRKQQTDSLIEEKKAELAEEKAQAVKAIESKAAPVSDV